MVYSINHIVSHANQHIMTKQIMPSVVVLDVVYAQNWTIPSLVKMPMNSKSNVPVATRSSSIESVSNVT
jgi:hypothetical protein